MHDPHARPVNAGVAPGPLPVRTPGIVTWLHFGDLHLTRAGEQNHRDLLALIDEANRHLDGDVQFAVLPGDNADDGTEDEYALVERAASGLRLPLYAIPGDHDLRTGSLGPFRRHLSPAPWSSFRCGDVHFLLLDALETDRPDRFRLGDAQLAWLRRQLDSCAGEGCRAVLFLHCYPSEVRDHADALCELIDRQRVLMVDMGHTHYNELANDGHTIYAATRSTGQIEEGPAGFSLATVDGGVVSWKFKPLGAWPFVTITSPAERLLITDPDRPDQLVRGTVAIRAKAWDARGMRAAWFSLDEGEPRPMERVGDTHLWQASWDSTEVGDGDHRLRVSVESADGATAHDTITVLTSQRGLYMPPPRSSVDVENAIGAYREKGILGTQLGPNKNGRKWS